VVTTGAEDVLLAEAEHIANRSAREAEVAVRQLSGLHDYRAACSVIGRAFHVDDHYFVNPGLLSQIVVGGNGLHGAYRSGELVGVTVAVHGWFRRRSSVHSLIAAVVPEMQSSGIGFTLKLHQRSWALRRGIGTITWTYDALNTRNARFNIATLGASLVQYLVDPIGPLPPPMVHARRESDMGVMCWYLRQTPPHGEQSSRGAGLRNAEFAVALDRDDDGEPVVSTVAGEAVLCRIPPEIGRIRREQPELAARWTIAMRDAVGSLLERGYEGRHFLCDGSYVLVMCEQI
jgi:predicted GNAT superfamily acetyltransferase